ncbi:DNA-directed RNA polymerase subunit H [archaeon]|nr:DNA-directed RNA polymerase subunit H [archaeon]MBL7057135.1 DNA-directed RNA polymerase subunit H [Candidatus Woesearchaeota archaeon]
MAAKKEKINHFLVPEHSKLNDKEKKELMEKFHLTTKELPKIALTDAAIQHLDPKEKDVIKIIRKSSTAETTIFYRGVVNE